VATVRAIHPTFFLSLTPAFRLLVPAPPVFSVLLPLSILRFAARAHDFLSPDGNRCTQTPPSLVLTHASRRTTLPLPLVFAPADGRFRLLPCVQDRCLGVSASPLFLWGVVVFHQFAYLSMPLGVFPVFLLSATGPCFCSGPPFLPLFIQLPFWGHGPLVDPPCG